MNDGYILKLTTATTMAHRTISRFRVFCHSQYAQLHTSTRIPSKFELPSAEPVIRRPLRTIPLSVLLRSLSVLSVAALPSPILAFLVRATRRYNRRIASSPILRWVLSRTFYSTFCIGETRTEITVNMQNLRSMGISGVILAYAREADIDSAAEKAEISEHDPHLRHWLKCNLETIDQINHGDFLAVKYTGAGEATVRALEAYDTKAKEEGLERLQALKDAMEEICQAAKSKNVSVLVDAEYRRQEEAIDAITLDLMEKFNRDGRAVVYNTYQMYLKSTFSKMKIHLQKSQEKQYVMGIKMVRGAYLHFECERSIIHDTKEQTDENYNNAVAYLLDYPSCSPVNSDENDKGWKADVIIATHNTLTVRHTLALLENRPKNSGATRRGVQRFNFGQLMGMADEVSMSLVATIRQQQSNAGSSAIGINPPGHLEVGVFKYTVWGSFQDCLLYMLRRAEENKDAVARSRETGKVMLHEICQRMLFLR